MLSHVYFFVINNRKWFLIVHRHRWVLYVVKTIVGVCLSRLLGILFVLAPLLLAKGTVTEHGHTAVHCTRPPARAHTDTHTHTHTRAGLIAPSGACIRRQRPWRR